MLPVVAFGRSRARGATPSGGAGRLLPLYWVTIALADQLNADPTNWWVPNLRALHDLCEAAGFSRSETVQGPPPATAPVDSMEPGHYRAILHAFP